ncbi:MAG: FAD-dependent oxidoreductase, partial [Planktomarina sp.]|nr:FAD-dependent oxidoreductase [Planktomarina sp.]
MNFHEVSRDEAERLHPLVNYDGVRCIMFEPEGGNVDPSGVTNAYAAGARARGAEIHRFTPVTGTEQQLDGSWIVRTSNGDIHTQWVVNAAGLWGREVAALAGIELPLQPTEHQYFVTEAISKIADMGRRLPSVADRDGEYYLRQEGQGLLVGAYEKDLRFWAEEGTPLDFAHELFADDLDRIEENMMRAIERVPAIGTAGIKRVINGPMIWSPDSNVLYGPHPDLKNYFCCNGIIPGFSQSGGMGLMSAQWIIEGESHYDMFAWDVARFGKWADKAFTKARVGDQYARRFAIHFPNEEREAGRPVRVRPIHELQKTLGGVFGLNYGWEHAQWFADKPGIKDTNGFTRQNWFEPVGRECRMLREKAGVIDISNFAKYRVRGTAAADWLNAIFANDMPKTVGRSCLTPLIGVRGGIAGDFTVTRLGDAEFMIIGSGMAERYHQRFWDMVPMPAGVTFESLTDAMCGFNVAGPMSRNLLQRLTNTSLATADFPFMRSKQIELAGIDCLALRVSFTGDLGWELHCKTEDQLCLYNALLEAGRPYGAGPVGGRALMSLRIEKGYGSWSREYSPEYWPQEVGLEALIKLDKDFLHKDAYLAIKDKAPREILSLIEILDTTKADATGGEPIFDMDGNGVGRVTSGTYGYGVKKSLALCYLKNVSPGDEVKVMVIGLPHKGIVLKEPPFDPKGALLRE